MGADDPPATPLGHSVGRWDGRTLVVQTTRIDRPYFDDSGIPQSESVETTERFALSQDETELRYETMVDDPEVFTEQITGTGAWRWTPGQEVQPYNCEPYE